MEIYLLRHGDYLPEDQDPDKGLSPKGKEQVAATARRLKELGVHPEVVIASPKKRAVESAREAARQLGLDPAEVQTTEALKAKAAPEETVERLAGLGARRVLAAGHLPGLGLVASRLLTGDEEAVAIELGAGSVAGLVAESPPAGKAKLVCLLP
jgi:phosphohistidine phosphatase